MICQECNERPATLHFTKVVNGDKTVVKLCEKCAQEKGELFMMNGASGFSFNDLLAGLINFDPVIQQQKSQPSTTEHIIQCDVCKMTFHQFVKLGRFGCAHCYQTFNDEIAPVLKRLHGGNLVHGGKVPKRIGGSIHVKKKVESLKEDLRQLIIEEEFEKAAEVRDQIRSLESKILCGKENSE